MREGLVKVTQFSASSAILLDRFRRRTAAKASEFAASRITNILCSPGTKILYGLQNLSIIILWYKL